ncbi:MAG: DNA topoisomerase IV subunit B [Bacilli bacterium]|nr:DNA topoisomerase IV subunit B [Bacilli bacterium]
MANKEYGADTIKILDGLEAVRKRPGMYIGSTDKRGMHHLVWEIVDNAIDEAINGHGNKITVIINKTGSITVKDEGRGVPTEMHESGKSTPEVVYTVLHAGGKFESEGYKVSGGLHGVGSSVVNALSKWMKVTICRKGKVYEISFKDGGKVDKPLKEIGTTRSTGTTVEFYPDPEIFGNNKFSYTTICERMQESAFLINGLTMEVIDEEDDKRAEFKYDNGLVSFIEYINENKSPLHKVVQFSGEKQGIYVDIAMQYTDTYNENILSFVNNVKTIDGGSHEVGFKTALTKVFNEHLKSSGQLKGKESIEGSDTREGLSAVISLRIPEDILQFEGQTKGKLGTPQARSVVESLVYEKLSFFLDENKEASSAIMDKTIKSKIAREAARKARSEARAGKGKDKKEKVLLGKLTPAQSKDYMKNELFIVEGNSAGGTAKSGRDKKHQAILPLRGKIINCEKSTVADLFKNEEINTIVHAINAGIGNEFEPYDSNYGKVIIMTDADDDGAHIQVLLLTFFYRYMRPLIERGMLYIAMPPLYLVKYGKDKKYLNTNEELNEFKNTFKGNYTVQRYKGLGEMNADQLWETTMDPETRNLIRVSIEDSILAEKRVTVLMGDDAEIRKEWIEENVEFTLEDDYKGGK